MIKYNAQNKIVSDYELASLIYRDKMEMQNLNDSWFLNYVKLYARVWSYIALCILICMLTRTTMFFYSFDSSISASYSPQDIGILYGLGFLYDLQASAFLFCPFIFIGLIFLYFKKRQITINCILGAVLIELVLIINVLNFFYYQYFGTRIGTNFFLILDGQANATLAYIKKAYPILIITVLLGISAILIYLCLLKIEKHIRKINLNYGFFKKIIFIFLSLLIYISAMRCSIGGYGLYHDGLGNNQFIENGVAALYDAYKERQSSKSILATINDKEALDLYNALFNQNTSLSQFSINDLYTKTTKKQFSVTHPQPNVIFVQMESFGRHFLQFDNKNNELLGKLSPYFQQDFVFKNFLQGGNSTSQSLLYLMFNSFNSSFSALNCPNLVSSSVAKPFREAGYETVFLTSGSENFLNLKNFLPEQGFQHVIGYESILKKYPNAEQEDWGVYDEYMYQYAFYLLKKADSEHKPIFIYMNTVTNHPPYTLPSHYKLKPIKLSKSIHNYVDINPEVLNQIASTYRYANDALGDFIQNIDKSTLATKTIIAASGDHNQREISGHYKDEATLGLKFTVPFYLHIPQEYRINIKYDPKRIGSHKDIFPTLYELSLSEASYLNAGNNLLSLTPVDLEFGYNVSAIMFPEGIALFQNNHYVFYPWQDSSKTLVGKGRDLENEEELKLSKVYYYTKLMQWHFYKSAQLANCS
ncbi:LTA synthase family protein [Legionella bozemanae]|uniref:Phosphoglycerol transferase I n=1 Tax=Legionella bozemanae TaxID=447 RepID=A0A0W0RSI9_LEGBO|nr:LTA synthase family protein [Legionella bozemanae]KTC74032.1 phosphoglycerol transferase I [Legionella bozemanae]STO33619.1 phosphoglycerol transferase I [Legionella bozemanae]